MKTTLALTGGVAIGVLGGSFAAAVLFLSNKKLNAAMVEVIADAILERPLPS